MVDARGHEGKLHDVPLGSAKEAPHRPASRAERLAWPVALGAPGQQERDRLVHRAPQNM